MGDLQEIIGKYRATLEEISEALVEKEVGTVSRFGEIADKIEAIGAGKKYKLTITVQNFYFTWEIKITQGSKVQQFKNTSSDDETVEAYLKEGECTIEFTSSARSCSISDSNVKGVSGDEFGNWTEQAQISPNDNNHFTCELRSSTPPIID